MKNNFAAGRSRKNCEKLGQAPKCRARALFPLQRFRAAEVKMVAREITFAPVTLRNIRVTGDFGASTTSFPRNPGVSFADS